MSSRGKFKVISISALIIFLTVTLGACDFLTGVLEDIEPILEEEEVESIAEEILNAYYETATDGTEALRPHLASHITHHKTEHEEGATKEEYMDWLKNFAANPGHSITYWDPNYRLIENEIVIEVMSEEETGNYIQTGKLEKHLKEEDNKWKLYEIIPREREVEPQASFEDNRIFK